MKFIVVLQPKGWIATIQYMYSYSCLSFAQTINVVFAK